MRKKKQLELIESCRIISEQHAVFAGTTLPVILSFALQNGEVVYSNNGARFGFKDFNISISGSGRQFWRGKRKLTLASYYNAIDDPFIRVKVQMIERPEIKHSFSIPIHFNGTYSVSHNAFAGNDGSIGQRGRKGHNGRNEYSNHNGEDGYFGENGEHGYRGEDGYNASDVNVYVSLVDFKRDNTQLVKVQSCYADGRCETRYLSKSGFIKIYAIGGNGGDGGDGGKGGQGGDGGNGAFKKPATEHDRGCKNEGYGGNGGDGGYGGDGGPGGNGGHGGNVNLYFAPDAWFFKQNISVYNYGGTGGNGGDGGRYGSGGKSGQGGKGNGHSGRRGRAGFQGQSGYAGDKGTVSYFNWN